MSPSAPTVTPAKPTPAAPKTPKSPKLKLPIKFPIELPKKLPLPLPALAGIGGGVLVLLVLVVVYVFGGFGGGGSGPGKGGTSQTAMTPWSSDKREVTVGESGEYKTIGDALKAVRYRYEPTGAPNEMMVIKIAAGTYKENLSIDGTVVRRPGKTKKTDKPSEPDWPLGIKLLADGAVILEPVQDAPVIRLKNIPKFVVEGLTVNATGRPVAVEITGDVNESRLVNLKIKGFTQTGVACLGARGISFGNSQFFLDRLTLEPAAGSSNAIGIRMQSGSEGDPSDTIVRGCRLLGPMSAGVAISGTGPYRINIVETIFSKVQDGIRCEGAVQWKDIAIANNTFYEGRHGIVFTNMPAEGSMGLSVRRNLFSKMTGAEGIVQSGYDEGRFKGMLTQERAGYELNYSDRAKPETPASGEMNPLFDHNGKRGESGFGFASTDAKNPKFLAPTDKSVQRSVPGAKEGEKDWVGAVGP